MADNTYEFNMEFLDEEGYLLEEKIFIVETDSIEEAERLMDEKRDNNQHIYQSDNYEIQFLDTY